MKNLVTKLLTNLYPEHDGGTAMFISGLLLSAIMMTIITISDALTEGADMYEVACILMFVLLAAATYVFGKSTQE
ncbi:hypothetical protein GCM10011383_42380 [Hymenobacter cavernae]|uniref:Uncharacterized protein n=1 Tax=Hymenobacter cavernae TaxID=2044852 RepID=A0ABQ1UUC9_9BACT|nr:hypothetical protein GCM10011383_42380 [Hymenobacter cavernae]